MPVLISHVNKWDGSIYAINNFGKWSRPFFTMIIDGETVITGSFNFTKAAEEKNAENLLVIRDKALAAKYIENWKVHAGHSEGYAGRGK